MFKPKKIKPKNSIDCYVEGELIVGFEKNVSKAFANELIKLLGYEVLDDSRYDSKRLRGHMLIKVPEGKEHENIETLKGYKKIIRFAEPNYAVKGADKSRASKQKNLECKVCHGRIKKGDTFIETLGAESYVCSHCDATKMAEGIEEHPIASIDTENKK